jgi:hypothetical protein
MENTKPHQLLWKSVRSFRWWDYIHPFWMAIPCLYAHFAVGHALGFALRWVLETLVA